MTDHEEVKSKMMGDEEIDGRDWSERLANTVRPLTTFVAIGVFAFMSIQGKISTEAVMGVVSSILTFWFVQRQAIVSTAATTAAVVAAVAPDKAPPNGAKISTG